MYTIPESIRALLLLRQLLNNRKLEQKELDRIQNKKLGRLVRHAYATVPYYRTLMDRSGIKPVDIRSPADLASLPLTRKHDLQALSLDKIISSKFDPDHLTVEHTSGSTGQPFSLYFDPGFLRTRNILFLRALIACGYRPWKKVLLITDLKDKNGTGPLPGWYYTSILHPPEKLLQDLNRIKPDILYGCMTPLKILADFLHTSNHRFHRPTAIISTGETLDANTRQLIETAFATELFDFYGLTEMGIVGWECPQHEGYHLSQDTTIIEFVPDENLPNVYRLAMTNLNLYAMPLIRFETGDLVYKGLRKRCACSCRFPLVERFEGRTADVVKLENGEVISPYQLTCSLENITGLKQYQITQQKLNDFLIKVEIGGSGFETPDHKIRSVLHSILGPSVNIHIQKTQARLANPGTKFRIVASEV